MTKRAESEKAVGQAAGLLAVADAAKMLGVDRKTLKSWCDGGETPGLGMQIGKRLYIRRAVLEKMILGGFPLRSVADADPATPPSQTVNHDLRGLRDKRSEMSRPYASGVNHRPWPTHA